MADASEPTPGGSPRPARWSALGLSGVLLVAAWLRVTAFGQVFVGGEVIPLGPDSAYHLRRMVGAARSFPSVPSFDPYLGWPSGAQAPWAAGFDQLGALFILLGGSRGRELCAFMPVVLGLVTVALTYRLARILGDDARWLAVAAGLILATIPQAVAVATVGRLDHHVAEALSMVALASWALWALERSPAPARARGGIEICGGALAVASVHVFHGAIVYVAIAAVLLSGGALLGSHRGRSPWDSLLGSGAPALAVAASVLAFVARQGVAAHGHRTSFMYASYLQPGIVALAGAGIAASVAAARIQERLDRGEGWARGRAMAVRAGLLLGIGLPILALAALAARQELYAGAAGWLGKSNVWMASIQETRPLDLASCYRYLGMWGLCAPLLVPLGLWEAWRRDRLRGGWLVGWTAPVVVLTLIQARFGRVASVNLALVSALGLARLGALAARLASDGASRWRELAGAPVALVALLGAIFDPRLHSAALPSRRPLPALDEAALFLRRHTPPVAAGARPGVLSLWDMGFGIMLLGERPVLVSGFGPYVEPDFERIDRVWLGDEAAMLRLMDERDAGYVVAGAATYLGRVVLEGANAPFFRGADGQDYLNPDYFRELPASPLILGGSALPGAGVAHLGHLMPIHASTAGVGGLTFYMPRLWVYQRVAGAVLRGRGPARSLVVAELELSVHGRSMPYFAVTRADGEGSFALTVPVPTGASWPALESGPRYILRAGRGLRRSIAVSLEAVVAGREIDAGVLASAEK